MARDLTAEDRELLNSPDLKARVLTSWYMDSGTYRFCDDVFDMTNGVDTWLGASVLGEASDIRAGAGFAAESVTIVLDGNKINGADESTVSTILTGLFSEKFLQRRVDIALGFAYMQERNIRLTVPVYAGRITSAKLVDEAFPTSEGGIPSGNALGSLIITLDSLASRYGQKNYRTRSHADQQEIDPTDMFFSFTIDAIQNERTLYWGKRPPRGTLTRQETIAEVRGMIF